MIFSNCKNSDIPNITVFAGGANSHGWGTARPDRGDRAWPVIYSITGRSLTQPARPKSHPPPAKPSPRVSNITDCLPGLIREILCLFSSFFALWFLLEISRPQGDRYTAPSDVFGQPPVVHNRRTEKSLPCPNTDLRIPLVRVGCAVP